MKILRGLNSALIAWILAAGSLHAADTAKGFDAFRLVKTRNIFDPDRRAARVETPTRSGPAPTRTNSISVTGTMVADGKALVFFSGSRPEYSKVIPVGATIADFKVTGITNAQVELSRDGKQIVVGVGKQVPLEGSSAAIAPPGSPPSDAPAGAPADGPPPEAAAPAETKPASADEPNEVLRRMMERRQKEMSK